VFKTRRKMKFFKKIVGLEGFKERALGDEGKKHSS